MELVPLSKPYDTFLSSLKLCVVCDQPAHGRHFGALTCRACAAFFRRCHFTPDFDLQCNNQNLCGPSKEGKWNCKKCRLRRCTSLGMTTKNIQYNRDLFKFCDTYLQKRDIRKNLAHRIPVTVEAVMGQPHYICFNKKEPPTVEPLTFIDMSLFVDKLLSKLAVVPANFHNLRKLSDLEQLARGLEETRSSQSKSLTELEIITKDHVISGWEHDISSTLLWLNYSRTIQLLPNNLKLKLIQSVWFIWRSLERITITAQMRVDRQCGKDQFVISEKSLIDLNTMDADLSWWSQYSFRELEYLFSPRSAFYDDIVWDIVEVQPDNVELTFLIFGTCLAIAGKHVQGEILKTIESIQDKLCNDLHCYYIRKNRPVYTHRLNQLLKVQNRFIKMRNIRIEKFHICSILNVYSLDMSSFDFFWVTC